MFCHNFLEITRKSIITLVAQVQKLTPPHADLTKNPKIITTIKDKQNQKIKFRKKSNHNVDQRNKMKNFIPILLTSFLTRIFNKNKKKSIKI